MSKAISTILSLLILLICSFPGKTQSVDGVVRSKNATIEFENFGSPEVSFNGRISSNLLGSKYTVELKGDQGDLTGTITDKFSKFQIDLTYLSEPITGEIERSTNGTKDFWSVDLLGKTLNGKVLHNGLNTNDTYELKYGDKEITGTIGQKLNTLAYNLKFGSKGITGSMAYNINAVKHTYDLQAQNLTDDELVVFVFIETIKLINEHIADIEEFQSNE